MMAALAPKQFQRASMKQKSAKASQEKHLNMSRSKNNKIALPDAPPLYAASPNDRELQRFTKKWADELYQG